MSGVSQFGKLIEKMGVKISGLSNVAKQISKLERLDIPINRATRRMQRGIKTDASNAIREEVALTKTYVDSGLTSKAEFATATKQESSVTVSAQMRGALLRNYKHSYSKKNGVRITIKKGRQVTIKRGFKIRLKNGIETVAWRKHKKAARNNLVLHGPSPSQILNTKQDEVKQKGEERFAKELNHEIGRHLNGS